MPKLPEPALTDQQICDAKLAAYPAFKSGFRQSSKNPANVCREWNGSVITIFRKRDGTYGWSISTASEDTLAYGEESHESREDCLLALFDVVGGF